MLPYLNKFAAHPKLAPARALQLDQTYLRLHHVQPTAGAEVALPGKTLREVYSYDLASEVSLLDAVPLPAGVSSLFLDASAPLLFTLLAAYLQYD